MQLCWFHSRGTGAESAWTDGGSRVVVVPCTGELRCRQEYEAVDLRGWFADRMLFSSYCPFVTLIELN